MRNMIILLTLLFFANVEASVNSNREVNADSLYNKLVEGYEKTGRWANLSEVGYLNPTEVKTLVKKEANDYAKKVKSCSQRKAKANAAPEFCLDAFKEALNRFIESYSGSVADTVIKFTMGALMSVDDKGYTVER